MGRTMDSTAPRTARLQAIRDRWFGEPLGIDFPPLTESDIAPTTADQFVRSNRMSAAFSSLHEAPETAGMTREQALAHDRQLNSERFGVESPKDVMAQLSLQFDRAPSGQVDPEPIKKGFVVLNTVRADSVELAAEESLTAAQASHLADAQAITRAQSMVSELAAELGISLPVGQGAGRKK